VWLAEVPGKTVRSLIAAGTPPTVDSVLDGIEPLWNARASADARPFSPENAYKQAERLLRQALSQDGEALELLDDVACAVGDLLEGWQPTGLAHNDFYDDQLVVDPQGRIFLVDFEEIAPGDPLLDIGNFLAHMRWMARFRSDGAAFESYGSELRQAALARFGWHEADLAMRECLALLRLSTNPIRRLHEDWPERAKSGLRLAIEAATTDDYPEFRP
jgi:thiamine kinase-like enzyme